MQCGQDCVSGADWAAAYHDEEIDDKGNDQGDGQLNAIVHVGFLNLRTQASIHEKVDKKPSLCLWACLDRIFDVNLAAQHQR